MLFRTIGRISTRSTLPISTTERKTMTCVCILGATGLTGVVLTKQVLAKSGEGKPFTNVRLVVRNKSKFPSELLDEIEKSSHVKIFEGDFTSEEFQKGVMEGVDVVLSVIGYAKGSPTGYFSKTIEAVIKVLSTNEPKSTKKLIVLEGAAMKFEATDEYPLMRRLMITVLKLLLGSANYEDMDKTLHLTVEGSHEEGKNVVDGVVVRPPGLTNGPLTEKYNHDKYLGSCYQISRENLSHFMVSLAVDEDMFAKYKGFAPMCAE